MATNPFTRGINVATDLIPVTPDDDAPLTEAGRAFRCRPDGFAGEVHFLTNTGAERTTAIAAGETILVAVTKVFQTGTTATGLEIYV